MRVRHFQISIRSTSFVLLCLRIGPKSPLAWHPSQARYSPLRLYFQTHLVPARQIFKAYGIANLLPLIVPVKRETLHVVSPAMTGLVRGTPFGFPQAEFIVYSQTLQARRNVPFRAGMRVGSARIPSLNLHRTQAGNRASAAAVGLRRFAHQVRKSEVRRNEVRRKNYRCLARRSTVRVAIRPPSHVMRSRR
jgi:hypothetical protein